MVDWVKSAWQKLSSDIIIHSFEACAITTSDPDLIHCVNDGGMDESAKDAINLVNDSSDENTDEDADEQEEINDSDEIECL